MIHKETLPQGVCLDRDELDAFNRGQLPPDKLEGFAEHLSSCERCASSLQGLQGTDTIQMHLRREPTQELLLDDPVCRQLEELARAIPLEQTGTITATQDTSIDSSEGLMLPAVFGAYVLLERLGQGGMGIVYKARQESLKRLVALKMVRAGVYASAEERMRFQREGEVIARLRHSRVVQIHEFGEHNGQLFFSMELLEGGTLVKQLNGRPLPERQGAELVRTLAQAVQAAHQQGIVHRDLKPANVLFAADGTVRITDFGLAKVLDEENSDTRSDAILGTPAYMAPEQARGESRGIGPAADVYALGAILYEALTGRPPFRAQSRLQTLEWVRDREVEAPSRRRAGLARDLEAICLKCLEKQPARRYPSAAALADDLERWLKGEPTWVRPPSRAEQVRRWLRKHPRTIVAAAVLAVLIVGGSLAWFRFDPERPIRDIERRLERGEVVTLIGETGKPRWSSFKAGGGGAQASERSDDGAFTMHTWSLALLELVRDPRQESYRLRAEVRQSNSSREYGHVGIYVAYRQYPTSQGNVHSLVQWSFNDINDVRLQFANIVRKPPRQKPPKGNPLRLEAYLFAEGEPQDLCYFGLFGLASSVFEPGGLGRTDWRQIALEVTPQGIRGFWEGKLSGEISADRLAQVAKERLDTIRKDTPDTPCAQVTIADFSPRGGAGLYVNRASASFRRVVIEPLKESE